MDVDGKFYLISSMALMMNSGVKIGACKGNVTLSLV